MKVTKIMTAEGLLALQTVEIEILKEFVKACEKLNLHYYILGGTLLGAIRHSGFIPWDDDIDVGMPREDYERFIEEAPQILPPNLFVQNIWTEPEYLMCFTKIRDSNTTLIETRTSQLNINHGVFVDVFPLDYYPEEKGQQRNLENRKKWISRRIGCEFSYPEGRNWRQVWKSRILKWLLPNTRCMIEAREETYRNMPISSMMANYGGAWGKREVVPVEWYGEGEYVDFAGMRLCAPKEYIKWLTQVYGDYMILPPVEKRVSHHSIEVMDLSTPYTQYTRQGEN